MICQLTKKQTTQSGRDHVLYIVATRLWSKSSSKFQTLFSKLAAGAEPIINVMNGFEIVVVVLLLLIVYQEDENQGFHEKY